LDARKGIRPAKNFILAVLKASSLEDLICEKIHWLNKKPKKAQRGTQVEHAGVGCGWCRRT